MIRAHEDVALDGGIEIAQFGAERRQFVPIAEIPAMLQGAVLAIEDTRFEHHIGLDPIGIARAVLANLGGGMRQGASTITQQVARNFFLSPSKTLERKLKEVLLALQIERRLSKAQILDRVWNYDFGGQANVVELYISYLRKKIDQGREPLIHTVRGVGYEFAGEDATAPA